MSEQMKKEDGLRAGYRVGKERMNEILAELTQEYHVFGPCLDAQKKRVRYAEIRKVEQIIYDRQSDFSPKAAFYPVSQVMFYFREDSVEESELADDKGILIFARACDINAIRRQDNLFLRNGGAEDLFYKRLRDRVKYVLMECTESYENCFCVSVGSNVAEDYALAVRFGGDPAGTSGTDPAGGAGSSCTEKLEELLVEVRDEDLASYFEDEEEAEFKVRFIQENEKKLRIPQISRENLKAVSDLPYWSKFDNECIACGGCNTVCGTCTCFDTVDVVYTEGSNDGERRRVWSGCMLEDFTETAGGARARKTKGANMRFKVFHKFYDYKDRFGVTADGETAVTADGVAAVTADGVAAGTVGGEHMCVGCGRCDIRCPKNISFFNTVCEVHDEIEKM